jgi:DNA-binding winged helix-turn-helix (wHTH) protein
VWGFDAVVTTRAVDHRVAEIRAVLGDDASAPTYLETVPGVGYRFVAPVIRG